MENYIFDFDLTLVDSGKVNVRSTQSAFRDMGWQEPTPETVAYYTGIPIEVSFPKMAPKDATPEEMHKLKWTFIDYYQEMEKGNLKVFDGMKDVLNQLKQAGKKLFIASSNHSGVLVRNSKALGIYEYFDDIIGSDNVKNPKPDPDEVLKILNDYHLDSKDTIMIGDATYDLKMGKNAGVKTVGVTWGAHTADNLRQVMPDYMLNNVDELLKI